MAESRIEFAVQMTCDSCVKSVKNALAGEPSIKNVQVDLDKGSVVVDTTLPTLEVQQKLENTGKKVVVRGFGGNSAGVAILDTGEVQGVVRFVQVGPDRCIVDGTVDGLKSGERHFLRVHECGDISEGCSSVGSVYPCGDLGSVDIGQDGRSVFKKEIKNFQLSEVIGRSLVLSLGEKRLGCGIIARSAGLFQNPKTICACDGITIWNEKVAPKSTL